MRRLIFILLIAVLFVEQTNAQEELGASHAVSIEIPSVAIIDVEGAAGNSITLTPSFSGEAGEGLDFSSARDNSLWLNYTSLLSGSSNRRKITVKKEGALPRGMSLRVNPANPTGVGDLGNARGAFNITNNEKNLITVIRNCYTKDGVGNGSQLTYFLKFNNRRYSDLKELNSSITVTYTIVDY